VHVQKDIAIATAAGLSVLAIISMTAYILYETTTVVDIALEAIVAR
jgi:hypothetical protein